MMLGTRSIRSGLIDSIPSLPIHSSALIVLIAGLFLVALMIRARRLSARQAARSAVPYRGLRAASARVIRRVRRKPGARRHRRPRRVLSTSVREDTHLTMSSPDSSSTTDSSQPETGTAVTQGQSEHTTSARQRREPEFTIYWGRTFLALALLVSILGALVTAGFAMAGMLGWIIPGACAAVMVLSLASLQIAARVRRRNRRRASVNRALQDAMNAQGRTTSVARSSAVQPQQPAATSTPFNALDRDAAGQGGPDSLIRHDEDGLADSAERVLGANAVAQVNAAVAAAEQNVQTYQPPAAGPQWAPDSVPQPKYLLADKALRPEIIPVHVEQAPSSQVKIHDPAAPAVDAELSQVRPASQPEQSLNISEALKRRRA